MNLSSCIKRIAGVAVREYGRLCANRIYLLCMVVLPLLVTVYFTSLMAEGQPTDMPVGIVDNDNTQITRSMVRNLDAFQAAEVVKKYATAAEARKAMQQNDIYAFLWIPEGTTSALLSMRQPKISFYYSSASITAGSLLYRDLKTISTLGSASAAAEALAAKGLTKSQVSGFLQPIVIDTHNINNPAVNYNIYLSTMIIPGCIMLFIFLVTVYSIGTELKDGTSKEWIKASGNNIIVAITGKLLPQTAVFLTIFYAYLFYIFGVLHFPCLGGYGTVLMLGLLAVTTSQGFGIFMFGIIPSLRMALSVCSLWGVLSFSLAGTAFPLSAMDSQIQAIAQLIPLRHYFMIYQINVFNGYPALYSWLDISALVIMSLLPLLVAKRIRRVMNQYKYLP